MTINELRTKLNDLITEWKAITTRADHSNRDLTDAENARCVEIGREVDAVKEEIRKQEEIVESRRKMQTEVEVLSRVVNPLPTAARGGGNGNGEALENGGFANIAEYFFSLAAFKRDGRRDERLAKLYNEKEQRDQQMGVGSTGGFALPTQFDAKVRQINPQEQLVRPRATIIPAGSPPDALLSFPTLDQTSSQNMFGGVVITHSGEGITMNETSFKLREGVLEPKELSAFLTVTNRLLNNWQAGAAFIEQQLKWAIAATEDFDMLRGSGVNCCLGVINSSATISHNRATPGAISFTDVINMLARVKMGGNLVWAASQTIIPQLAAMVDAGGHAVWLGGNGNQGAAANAAPSTLMGFPLLFVDRMPPLGTKGDLCLLNLPYYLIKDGSGPIVASSEHILFLSNKTVFKIVWNVDARPWLSEPIPLEGSTSNTISPFVILN